MLYKCNIECGQTHNSSLPGLQSTPVMLTKKNLLVTHSVLRLCLDSGPMLLTSWLTVLTTLQHLCWVCNIVPKSSSDFIQNTTGKLSNEAKAQSQSTSTLLTQTASDYSMGQMVSSTFPITLGSTSKTDLSELSVSGKPSLASISSGSKSLKGTNGAVGTNGGVMGVVVEFGSCLSQGVTRLIETSVTLDDVSLHHIINAMTNMSQEAMEIAYLNKVSPSVPTCYESQIPGLLPYRIVIFDFLVNRNLPYLL